MDQIVEKLAETGLIPVVKLSDANKAVPLANALCKGGIRAAEITFRTDACIDAIKTIKKECPEMLVGAGTVLTVEQAEQAIAAGAAFIVSPGLNPKVVSYCQNRNMTVIPGCATPGEVEQALELGLDVVKFFPAEAAGGLCMIKALAAPYKKLRFFPTGGIDINNMLDYLTYEQVLCCGGTWMVPEKLIEQDAFEEISRITEQAVKKMMGFRIAHIGINSKDSREAKYTADKFADIFGFEKKENPASIFTDDSVEVVKTLYLGEKGHIAIATYSVERAMAYLKKRGVEFLEDSVVYRANGSIQAIYLKDEIAGFAIHLVRKP